MADHSMMKLGRRPARVDLRVPALKAILSPAAPAAPARNAWSLGRTDWGVLANDNLGDCTAAGVFHLIEVATAATQRVFKPTRIECIAFYSASTGYNPKDPSTDQGGVELDVLNYWLRHDVLNRQLIGHATVDPKNIDHVKQGAFLFPGLYAGLALPLTAQTQDVWDCSPIADLFNADAKPGSWGGHCAVLVDYDDKGVTFITWGALKKATWRWVEKYCDELHAALPGAWISNELSPTGISYRLLQTFMAEL